MTSLGLRRSQRASSWAAADESGEVEKRGEVAAAAAVAGLSSDRMEGDWAPVLRQGDWVAAVGHAWGH